MNYCKECKVKVKDSSQYCPLCEAPLQTYDDIKEISRYPDLDLSQRSYSLLRRIYFFISAVIIVVSIGVDVWLDQDITWSFLSIAAVLYSFTVIYHAVRNNVHIASKIFVQALSGSIFIFFLDKITGFDGWSVNYVIPQILILANVTIFVLMMINRMLFREFAFYQLAMTVIGFIPIVLILNKMVTRPMASYVSIMISAIILIGTLIFGDKTVKSELIRRFHV